MQQRSAETKEKILLTAQELFSTAGYDATGVSQICTAAGLSKGAFYHHFPSKHAVFMTLLQNWLDEMDAVFSTASVESNGVLAGISRMANSSDIIFDQVQGHFPLFLEFWSKSIRDERVWEETKQPFLILFLFFPDDQERHRRRQCQADGCRHGFAGNSWAGDRYYFAGLVISARS